MPTATPPIMPRAMTGRIALRNECGRHAQAKAKHRSHDGSVRVQKKVEKEALDVRGDQCCTLLLMYGKSDPQPPGAHGRGTQMPTSRSFHPARSQHRRTRKGDTRSFGVAFLGSSDSRSYAPRLVYHCLPIFTELVSNIYWNSDFRRVEFGRASRHAMHRTGRPCSWKPQRSRKGSRIRP